MGGKRLVAFGAFFGATAGAVGALYYALLRRPLAQTGGAIHLSGLQRDVEIIRDRWGVPHIYAQDPRDLFFAQGFVHAQDRLFQMEFSRRLGAGRLAEVLGPLAIDVDRWLRVIGLRRVAEKEVALLGADAREWMFAYASGVNAFIDQGKLPVEFTLLRYRPERWQIADSLTWIKFMDWSLAVNWEAELLRAQLIARLGPERVAALDAPYPPSNPITLPAGFDWSHVGAGALTRAHAARSFSGPPTEAGLGSNNWAVDGSRTAGGAPLLASDMHLALTMPAIWYENHLCGGDFDVIGLSLAGAPGVVAGHNGRVAWSFTAGFADTQDLYVERLNPENRRQYEFEGAWHTAEVLREEIVIKGSQPVIEEVLITRHGPLIDGLSAEAGEPLALRWTALEPSDMAALLFEIACVRDCAGFHQALPRWSGPVLNAVYADVEGNIGYTLAGRMPLRAPGHDGRTPVPGWTGEYEWRGYVPFEHWPHALNPPDGVFITANAKPVGDDYPYFLGHSWGPGFRAARIAELLGDARELTVADFCRMQFDQKSVLARRVGEHLRRLESHIHYPLSNILENWSGDLSPDSPAAALYQVFIRRLLYNVLDAVWAEAGAPPDAHLADRFVGQGIHPLLSATSWDFGSNGRALVARWLDEPDAFPLENHSLDELMEISLREAAEYLQWRLGPEAQHWRWGALHQLTYAHPLGQVKPLDKLFNRGPYPVGGDDTTVWATSSYYHSLDTERMVGPVCRFVIDLSNLSQSCSLNAPGQSGQPGSSHYADRIQAWLVGDYHPLLYEREEIERQSEAILRLQSD
jgi:penicillin amidase